MSEYTETLNRIAKEEARSHMSDIEAATEAAVTRLREETWFADFVDDLVRSAVKSAIHYARSRMSREAKRPTALYGESAEADVSPETLAENAPVKGSHHRATKSPSSGVIKLVEAIRLTDMPLEGTTLGELTFGELPSVCERLAAQGAGIYRKWLFVKRLVGKGSKLQKVKNKVTEGELRRSWSEIESMDMTPAVAMEPTLSQAGN